MDASASPYHTRLLSSKTSTRLLTLRSGSGDDAIKCSLMSICLDTNPRYEALSYCWGSPVNSQSVLLNGLLIEVRENLWQALWHLRLSHQDRILWIDALCINQENILERNHQVGLMSRIYSKAVVVLAWLGLASGNSNMAMDTLAYNLDGSERQLQTGSNKLSKISAQT